LDFAGDQPHLSVIETVGRNNASLPLTKENNKSKEINTMKKFATALAALTIFAAPTLADTVHTDGPAQIASPTSSIDTKQDFAATITPVISNTAKNTNFGGGHTFQPHELRR